MQQSIHSVTKKIRSRVVIPGSKSITNRALLLAALAKGESELMDILISDDTRVFIDALRELGVVITLDKAARACRIVGASGVFSNKKCKVWCGDAGTAARFLLAACASTMGIYHFDGSGQLRSRPLEPLMHVLGSQGAKWTPIHARKMPFKMIGAAGLQGGEISVDSSQTGQFVSALLMVAPFAKTPSLIKTNDLVSQPYVEMTCEMMGEFGVRVERMPDARFYVSVPQCYEARKYFIEPDLSTASYFFAAAAVTGGEISIQPVDRASSKQADVEFLAVLEMMGCDVIESDLSLTVRGPVQLEGVTVDMKDFSDTFMTLAAMAPFAKTPTKITHIGHARFKESDRINAMHVGLEKLKVKVESGEDWMIIYPSIPQAETIESFHDHRIAMAFSVTGLRTPGLFINNSDCVSKTCPEFFSLWKKITTESLV